MYRTPMVNVGTPLQELEKPYTAWPYGSMWYDEVLGTPKLHLVYRAGTGHVSGSQVVYYRNMAYQDSYEWSEKVVVADRTGEGLDASCHAAGVAPNGDYIALIRWRDSSANVVGYDVARSTDKGTTWVLTNWKADGVDLWPREAGEIFTTKSGAILTYCRMWDFTQVIARSTDNGITWHKLFVTNPFEYTPNGPLEGTFVQIPDGTIISIVRKTLGDTSVAIEALFTISEDDGLTWSPLSQTNIQDMSNNNGAIVYHPKRDTIEIFYASRLAQSDGYGSIYQAITTPEKAKQGLFNPPKRIQQVTAGFDSGYPAVVKTPDERVFMAYYNGTSSSTKIYLMANTNEIYNGDIYYKASDGLFSISEKTTKKSNGSIHKGKVFFKI